MVARAHLKAQLQKRRIPLVSHVTFTEQERDAPLWESPLIRPPDFWVGKHRRPFVCFTEKSLDHWNREVIEGQLKMGTNAPWHQQTRGGEAPGTGAPEGADAPAVPADAAPPAGVAYDVDVAAVAAAPAAAPGLVAEETPRAKSPSNRLAPLQ